MFQFRTFSLWQFAKSANLDCCTFLEAITYSINFTLLPVCRDIQFGSSWRILGSLSPQNPVGKPKSLCCLESRQWCGKNNVFLVNKWWWRLWGSNLRMVIRRRDRCQNLGREAPRRKWEVGIVFRLRWKDNRLVYFILVLLWSESENLLLYLNSNVGLLKVLQFFLG